eukprot:gene56-3453_t
MTTALCRVAVDNDVPRILKTIKLNLDFFLVVIGFVVLGVLSIVIATGSISQFDTLTGKLESFVSSQNVRSRQLQRAVLTFLPLFNEQDKASVLAILEGKKVKWTPTRCGKTLDELVQNKRHVEEQQIVLRKHIGEMHKYLGTLRKRYEEEQNHRMLAEAEANNMLLEIDRIRQILCDDEDSDTTGSSVQAPSAPINTSFLRTSGLRDSLLRVIKSPTNKRRSNFAYKPCSLDFEQSKQPNSSKTKPLQYKQLTKLSNKAKGEEQTHLRLLEKQQDVVSASSQVNNKKRSIGDVNTNEPDNANCHDHLCKKAHSIGQSQPIKISHTQDGHNNVFTDENIPPGQLEHHPETAVEVTYPQSSRELSPNIRSLRDRFESPKSSTCSRPNLPGPTSPIQRSFAPSPLRVVHSPVKAKATPPCNDIEHPVTPKLTPKQHWQPTVFNQCTQTSPATLKATAPPALKLHDPSTFKKAALAKGENVYNPTIRPTEIVTTESKQTEATSSPRRILPHFFQSHTAFLRQACQQCQGTVLYLSKYRKCSTCGFICHVECEKNCSQECGLPFIDRGHRQCLDLQCATEPGFDTPSLLISCFECIEERWLHSPNLYRHAGKGYEHKGVELIQRFLRGKEPNLRCITDPHEITTCIKLFLADLNEPILTSRRHDNFVHAVVNNSGKDRLNAITAVVETLPRINFYTLKHIIDHLQKVSAHSNYNNATRDVIVVEMASCLLRVRQSSGNEAMKPEEEVVDALLSLKQSHWNRAAKMVDELDPRIPGDQHLPSPKRKSRKRTSSNNHSPFRWFART